MDDFSPVETVHAAVDDLLFAVARAADDLQAFHAAVSHAHARLGPLPPFPRATVALTARIIDHLKDVDEELREVMTALGLVDNSERNRSDTR
jgi:hypothetical protein